MFPAVGEVTTVLENFTLRITGTVNIGTEGADSRSELELDYQQSEQNTFYMRIVDDEESDFEVWHVDGQLMQRGEDGISEGTPEFADDVDVHSYLSVLPEVERISDAEEVGSEDVAGLSTTRYSVPADDALQYMPGMQDVDTSDAEGFIEIWHAEEEAIGARIVVDLTWTNADDSEGTADMEYVLTNIGTTADVELPQD